MAPALPLAQAIRRWGNYFNQELFGGPTDLPWALEIDQEHLPPGYPPGTTFHPTFLYESLWNFALCGLLLWIDKRYRPAGGRLLAMYVGGYGVGRFWIEGCASTPTSWGLGGTSGCRSPDRRRWPLPVATRHKPQDPVLRRSSTLRRPSMARLSPSPAETTTTLPRRMTPSTADVEADGLAEVDEEPITDDVVDGDDDVDVDEADAGERLVAEAQRAWWRPRR